MNKGMDITKSIKGLFPSIFLLLMGHPKQHNLVIAPEIGMIYEYIKTRTKNRKTSAIKNSSVIEDKE